MSLSRQEDNIVIPSDNIKVKHFPERCDTRIHLFDFIHQWSEVENIKKFNTSDMRQYILEDSKHNVFKEYVDDLSLINIGYVMSYSQLIKGANVRKYVLAQLHNRNFILKEQEEFFNEKIWNLGLVFNNEQYEDYDAFLKQVKKVLTPRNVGKILRHISGEKCKNHSHFQQWLKNENFAFQHEIAMYKMFKSTIVPNDVLLKWGLPRFDQFLIHFNKNGLLSDVYDGHNLYWNYFDSDYTGIENHTLDNVKNMISTNLMDLDVTVFENSVITPSAALCVNEKDYTNLIHGDEKNIIYDNSYFPNSQDYKGTKSVVLNMCEPLKHSHYTTLNTIGADGMEVPLSDHTPTVNAIFDSEFLLRVDLDSVEELCCMLYYKSYKDYFPRLFHTVQTNRPTWRTRTNNSSNRFWLETDSHLFMFGLYTENFIKEDQGTLARFFRGTDEYKTLYPYKGNRTFYREVTKKHYIMGLVTFLYLVTGISCSPIDDSIKEFSNIDWILLLVSMVLSFAIVLIFVFALRQLYVYVRGKNEIKEVEADKIESTKRREVVENQKRIYFPKYTIMYLLCFISCIANINALGANTTICKSNILALSEINNDLNNNKNIIFYGKSRQYWSPINNQCFEVESNFNSTIQNTKYYLEVNDAHYQLVLKDQMLCGDPFVTWKIGSGCGINRYFADCPSEIKGAEYFTKKSIVLQNKGCLIENSFTRACISVGAASNWEYETYVVEDVKPIVTVSLYENGEYLTTKQVNENSDNTISYNNIKITLSSFTSTLHKKLIGKMIARRLAKFNILKVIENFNPPGYQNFDKFCWAQRQQSFVRIPFDKMIEQTVVSPINIAQSRAQAKFHGVSHSKIFESSPTIQDYTGKDWHLYTTSEKLNNDLYYYTHSHHDKNIPNAAEYFSPDLEYKTEPLTIMRTFIGNETEYLNAGSNSWEYSTLRAGSNQTYYMFFEHAGSYSKLFGGSNLLSMTHAVSTKVMVLEFPKGFRMVDANNNMIYETINREQAKVYLSDSTDSKMHITNRLNNNGYLDETKKYLIQGTLDELVLSKFAGRWRVDKENFTLPFINRDMDSEMSSEIDIKVNGVLIDNNYSCKVTGINISYKKNCYDLTITTDKDNCVVSLTTNSLYLNSKSVNVNSIGETQFCFDEVQSNHKFNITGCSNTNCITKEINYVDFILSPKSFYYDIVDITGTIVSYSLLPINFIADKLMGFIPADTKQVLITWLYRSIMIVVLVIVLLASLGVSYYTLFKFIAFKPLSIIKRKKSPGKIKIY